MIKRRAGERMSSMDVSVVEKFMENRNWEEVIDKDTEDKMIVDIEAWTEENFGIEGEDHGEGWAWDDVRDKQLDVKKVREARSEEVNYMINKGIWKVVDVKECWDKTGKAPVTDKWVDTTRAARR